MSKTSSARRLLRRLADAAPAAKHLKLLQGRDVVVLARDADGDRIVGFVTAVGDDVTERVHHASRGRARPSGRGIGSELVRRMLTLLESAYMVDLCCAEDLVGLHERFEMSRWVGMGLRDREALLE